MPIQNFYVKYAYPLQVDFNWQSSKTWVSPYYVNSRFIHRSKEECGMILPYQGKKPRINGKALVSKLATVVGNVGIGEGTSVFPGCVLRGDVDRITIGRYSNLQENVVVHCGDIYDGDVLKGYVPVEIGDYVTIGHGSIVHGCRIDDICLIGAGAIVFNNARIGEGSIVGMGAVVLKDSKIPPRSVVVGIPAKPIREVDEAEYSKIKKHAIMYSDLAKSHRGTLF
ncbi:MAG: gamma carbonic anhydrase family protein [Candidatus Bathyarchaeota archaeon]|nr:MAG: gamma carbonic anhydrase family protein [Candidatus Bathyarchaeota archaeon]